MEQPLPKDLPCNLSSINISKYVANEYTENADIQWDILGEDIYKIVRAMDDIIDENSDRHALQAQRENSKKYRNIGIGLMGIADLFCKMMMKYGDEDSISLIKDLGRFIFRKAILASVKLAEERGNFEGYDDKIWDASILKECFSEEELEFLRKNGKLRNCSLLSIAPSGSIGTMLNVSTGIEPFFALSYTRKTESLDGVDMYHKVFSGEAKYYLDRFNTTELPEYFVTSKDIHYGDRISIQAGLQKFLDTAISSTINLPKDTTLEDIMDIYIKSWQSGLKGVTIYVDGSRDAILTTDTPTTTIEDNRRAKKRPKVLEADYYQSKARGETFCVIVGLLDDKPYEVFAFKIEDGKTIPNHRGSITKVKKQHYKFESDLTTIDDLILANDKIEERAATLYCSQLLREGANVEHIVKTAKKVDDNIVSFSSAMCRVLSRYIGIKEVKGEVCPECGATLVRSGGCIECSERCGYSKCG